LFADKAADSLAQELFNTQSCFCAVNEPCHDVLLAGLSSSGNFDKQLNPLSLLAGSCTTTSSLFPALQALFCINHLGPRTRTII
jgi:hypothetical protein